jgi:hypothetical protein
MEITESKNKTTVRAVSTTADVSTSGRGGKLGPPGWKYTKKSNLRSEDMASKRAKAAIKAWVVIVLRRSSAMRGASSLKAANTSFSRGSSIEDTFYTSPPWK